jgi:hypothetical protein
MSANPANKNSVAPDALRLARMGEKHEWLRRRAIAGKAGRM